MNIKGIHDKNKKGSGGFTLAELIIVLAILAILAAVAFPLYRGYVKKANLAADRTLVDSINKSFAAACEEQAVSRYDIAAASLPINSDGSPGALSSVELKGGGDMTAEISEAFEFYFAGNRGRKFRVFTSLEFMAGIFVGSDEGNGLDLSLPGGGIVHIDQATLDALRDNPAFGEDISLLQSQLDSLSGALGEIGEDLSKDVLRELLGDALDDFLDSLPEGENPDTDSLGNTLLIYLSAQAGDITAQNAANTVFKTALYLRDNPAETQLFNALSETGSGGKGLSAVLLYGAVTAYANDSAGDGSALREAAKNVSDSDSLLTLFKACLKDDDFLEYCGNFSYTPDDISDLSPRAGFIRDMKSYLAVLELVSAAAPLLSTEDGALWSGDDFGSLLESALGG